MNETEQLLKEQVEYTLNRLDMLDPQDDGYKEATDRAERLYKALMEMEIKRQEAALKEDELNLKKEQLREDKIGRICQIAVDCGLAVITLGFNWVWMKRGFTFEQTGSFTSTTFRSLWQRFMKK